MSNNKTINPLRKKLHKIIEEFDTEGFYSIYDDERAINDLQSIMSDISGKFATWLSDMGYERSYQAEDSFIRGGHLKTSKELFSEFIEKHYEQQ